jgi:3-methyladenine DNA glycosylase/8-oxoguanine DNA glycosylase
VRRWEPGYPVDVALTLSILRMGRRDPCHQPDPDGSLWRTSLMASGPVAYRVRNEGRHVVTTRAWGPGSEEMLDGLERLLGRGDRPEDFEPRHPLLEEAHDRLVGLRVPATGRLLEVLVASILHQKISGRDASASWAWLLQRHGSAAPGPRPDMRVPPTAQGWLDVPQWDWRRAGVEPTAVATIRAVADRATALQRIVDRNSDDPAQVYRALTSIRGVGRWTAAEVGHRVIGDADAVPLGDYHLASLTGHALAGRPLEEAEVEGFLEPWRPHRYRVVRLLELTPRAWPPRRGPRMSRPEHRYAPY